METDAGTIELELFDADLAALFAGAMLFATASELEGLPLTLLEAMGHGLACAASDIPPHREVLGPDHPWYFPVGDVPALTRILEAAAADPIRRRAIGQGLRRRVAEHFNWDTAAAALAGLYRRVPGIPGPGRGPTEHP